MLDAVAIHLAEGLAQPSAATLVARDQQALDDLELEHRLLASPT
jgi:hypothetical protein